MTEQERNPNLKPIEERLMDLYEILPSLPILKEAAEYIKKTPEKGPFDNVLGKHQK